MTVITDLVRAALVPLLVATAAMLLALVCHVVLLHAIRELRFRRRQRLLTIYRPAIGAALQSADARDSPGRLGDTPPSHHAVVAELLLEPLRIAEGSLTGRARSIADALGLTERWQRQLHHRRWWIRAEAAHALGLLKCRAAVAPLIHALDDPVDEVRAAAVEALGLIGDEQAIPALIARFGEQSRHNRVRLVHAIRQFGSAATPPLLEHASRHPDDLASIANLLASAEAAGALRQVLVWCRDERAAVRAAAVRAIGAIGVDDRGYYHVLRALNDEDAEVRAAAAWTLGRSGRQDSACYLAARLQDQWIVAAQSARALSQLGPAGRQVLEAAAAQEDGELARQMLWESGALSPA